FMTWVSPASRVDNAASTDGSVIEAGFESMFELYLEILCWTSLFTFGGRIPSSHSDAVPVNKYLLFTALFYAVVDCAAIRHRMSFCNVASWCGTASCTVSAIRHDAPCPRYGIVHRVRDAA
ncbi:hypothetical protein ACLMAJ_13940, partial [Nocardia sp. KC 131]|uniref:hypothetical protein n=1 Tax=Nocardia arseniciresistens TaxID=3392119 RepID=UPI00398E34F7